MAGPHDPNDGSTIFPGYQLNAVADPSVTPWIFAGISLQAAFGDQFYINMVFNDPTWNYMTLNLTSDVDYADDKMAGILNSTNPDLSALERRGAKVIHFHGWEDNAISPNNSINYFKSVFAHDRRGHEEVRKDTFYRLFMVPGMSHCGGGPGANNFDALGALAKWVENGEAPDRLLATKYVNDDPAQGIKFTRPVCSFPKVAVWNGHGSDTDAANYNCRRND